MMQHSAAKNKIGFFISVVGFLVCPYRKTAQSNSIFRDCANDGAQILQKQGQDRARAAREYGEKMVLPYDKHGNHPLITR